MTSTPATKRPGVLRLTLRYLINGALVVGVLAVAALLLYPRLTGGHTFTVLTGSMEPGISPGDLVVTAPYADGDAPRIGDIVTFMPYPDDPTTITHRVIAIGTGDPVLYTTQGDANSAVDDPIEARQIVGQVTRTVPYVGHVTLFISNHRQPLIYGAVGALALYAVVMFLLPDRKTRKDAQEPASDGESAQERESDLTPA